MAANDPSFDVPTPRGVLQGVAAFSWDGSQWQPQGKAATEVATPTGVLRGVAAFSGDPNWSPNTRAQTEVPTPSGVLDGVAVYTWSGSQWTPPSGNIETATASGVLEGVAAFDWDGTNWQPQAQAGAEVPTPYGVLTGVARFGWTGSAWAAVGAPSLSLDFMTPNQLDSRITFSRASTATYTDANGVVQTAATNAPRWDYAGGVLLGLLIEEQRTNILLNNAALSTQSVAVTAQAYTLSFYGTGTVTKSGAATGALVGTGATQRVSQTFTPTAGTLTCTVTGSVLNAQLEAGSFATSVIPTTSVSVTRAADVATMPTNVSWYNYTNYTILGEYDTSIPGAGTSVTCGIGDDGFGNSAYLSTGDFIRGGLASVSAGMVPSINVAHKHAGALTPTTLKTCLDGGAVVSGANNQALQTTATRLSAGTGPWAGGTAAPINGHIRRVTYWNRALSDTEMQQVTT